jgi:hypothetical protein
VQPARVANDEARGHRCDWPAESPVAPAHPSGNGTGRARDITPESIEAGTSNTNVGRGFSANSAATLPETATDIKNNKVGVTTADQVRSAGGEVHDTPNDKNPTHVTVFARNAALPEAYAQPTPVAGLQHDSFRKDLDTLLAKTFFDEQSYEFAHLYLVSWDSDRRSRDACNNGGCGSGQESLSWRWQTSNSASGGVNGSHEAGFPDCRFAQRDPR